ncbi:membrane protein insertion efficiency factor YidD [Candidatus Daviesbacteria bacterium]|nr:membrane protein insertion efficiency factor YidD [Candidatus Daviesbacteria bacterium]
MSKILLSLIDFYQKFLSFDHGVLSYFAPGGSCRNYPTCSQYTKQMIAEYGSIRGVYLGLRRIISCR